MGKLRLREGTELTRGSTMNSRKISPVFRLPDQPGASSSGKKAVFPASLGGFETVTVKK
jgi:hypothetical protein